MGRFQAKKAVHVVAYAIDQDIFAAGFVDQISDDSKELCAPGFGDERLPVLHGKDGLDIDLMVRVCHDGCFKWPEPTALG